MSKLEKTENINRLQEIQEEIHALAEEAKELVQQTGDELIWRRAQGYWYASLVMALDDEHEFLGGRAGNTMADTIASLED